MYTYDDVITFVSQEDVKFIRLTFFDVFGRQKNVSVMPSTLAAAFRDGVAFDAGEIAGFSGAGQLKLFPDPSTLAVLPWRPSHGRVVRMYCELKRPDGSPYELDARRILKETSACAAKAGIVLSAASRTGFYLFRTGEDGAPTCEPFDRAGFMDVYPDDLGENVRRAICLSMEDMGLRPLTSHHEAGPGQNEITFAPSSPLSAADDAATFRWVVKSVSMQNGLAADFSPAPLENAPVSTARVSLTVGNADDKTFFAGIASRLGDIALFLRPSCGAWKTALEVGCADGAVVVSGIDPSSDPYLVLSLLISAGLEGASLSDTGDIPCDLAAAIARAERSEFVRAAVPAGFTAAYGGK